MERQIWLLVIFATSSSIGVSMLIPYIPLFGREIGMPISLVGYLIFAYYGIEVITRIPIGAISDIMGEADVIIVGSLSVLGASLFYLSSPLEWAFIFLAQLLLGIGISITWVTIPSFVTKTSGSLPIYTFAVGLGWLSGPPIGGLIRDWLGMYYLFLALFFISVILMILALGFHREVPEDSVILPPAGGGSEQGPNDTTTSLPPFPSLIMTSFGSFSDALELLKRRGRILIAALVSFIMFMSFAMGASLVPLYLSEIGFTSLLIGIFLSVRTGASTIIRLVTNKILRLGGKSYLLILSTISTGLAIFLVSFSNFLPILILLSIMWGLGGGIYLPLVFGLIADDTSEDERGVAMGLRGTMGTAGSAVGVLVFMNAANVFSVQTSLAGFGIFAMIFSVCLLLVWRILKD